MLDYCSSDFRPLKMEVARSTETWKRATRLFMNGDDNNYIIDYLLQSINSLWSSPRPVSSGKY
jgi:hypothetical protein